MIIYLVRHTKTDCPDGTCYGQSDVGVFSSFDKEKEAVIHQLKDIRFGKIFSSPLQRCALLARAIQQQHGNQIVFDDRLMELNFGNWEGIKWDEISGTAGAKQWFDDFLHVACPGGESYQDLLSRVHHFLTDLSVDYADENILIVTHAGVIRAIHTIIRHLEAQEGFNLKIDYGQVVTERLITENENE